MNDRDAAPPATFPSPSEERIVERFVASRRAGIPPSPIDVPLARPLESLVDDAPFRTAFFWSAPGGPTFVGLGASSEQTPQRAGELASLLRERGPAAGSTLRSCGGLPFDGEWTDTIERTDGFTSRGLLVTPRWQVDRLDGRTARIAASPHPPHDRERLDDEIDELCALTSSLARPTDRHPPPLLEPAGLFELPPARDWTAAVASALCEIDGGALEKVVLARAVELRSSSAPLVGALTARLGKNDPAAIRFAMRRGGRAFFGASPETLVAVEGDAVRTEALAGTPASDCELDRSLESDSKLDREHRAVVDEIRRRLAPFCSRVDSAERPTLLRLPHLTHLRTPIDGRLRKPTHVLDLVEALHPTPAVCGVPRGAALDLIRKLEPRARGWYAGPFGWFDGHGQGHFCVSIRSGLVSPDGVEAWAGAGLVDGSRPAAELEETERKLKTVLAAMEFAS